MKKNSLFARSFVHLSGALALLYLAHYIRFFSAQGPFHFMFTGVNCIAPLLQSLIGAPISGFIFALGGFLKFVGFSSFSIPCSTVTMGLATQASILVWHFRKSPVMSSLLTIALPFIAILFFVTHPATGVGAWYASFWIIPPALQLFRSESLLKTALQATFVAHAVGSCLWLISIPMTPHAWLALMPIVFVERLLYAGVQGTLASVCILETKEYILDFFKSFKQAS